SCNGWRTTFRLWEGRPIRTPEYGCRARVGCRAFTPRSRSPSRTTNPSWRGPSAALRADKQCVYGGSNRARAPLLTPAPLGLHSARRCDGPNHPTGSVDGGHGRLPRRHAGPGGGGSGPGTGRHQRAAETVGLTVVLRQDPDAGVL